MAKISMLDDIEGKGKSDSSSTLRYKLEQEEKIRKHYLEKFNGDEIKAKKATMEALAKIEEQEKKKSLDKRKKYWEEETKYATKASDKIKASAAQFGIDFAKNLGKAASNAVKNATSAALTSVERYIGIYDQYMSGIEARIQGSGKTFQGMVSTINGAIGSSQYVSQVKVLEKLNSLVEQGIGSNHYFPGELIKSGDTAPAGTSYTQDDKVICKIIGKLPPFMSAFSVQTSFFNPRSLTENHYLIFGHNTLDYFKNYAYITVKAAA